MLTSIAGPIRGRYGCKPRGNGGKVFVVSRSSNESEACAEELRRAGGVATGFAADVTSLPDLNRLADAVTDAHGGIDTSVPTPVSSRKPESRRWGQTIGIRSWPLTSRGPFS